MKIKAPALATTAIVVPKRILLQMRYIFSMARRDNEKSLKLEKEPIKRIE
jgi:hypothetical protein